MPLLVLVVGFAADYGYASYINQRFARAADSAAISAVSQDAATAVGGYGNLAGLQYVGSALLTENIKQLPVTNVTASVSVVSDGNGGVIATATYSYSAPSLFGGFPGHTATPVSGNIRSVAKPTTYVNYYILVDTSQSMGIATTQADMIALYNRVVQTGNSVTNETGCIFGCHVKETQNGKTQKYTNEDLAHNLTKVWGPKITLRIDSAITAIQSMITTASNSVGANKNIRFGIYAIQSNPVDNTLIKQIAPPSSNYSAPPSNDYATLYTLASTLSLGDNVGGGFGDSDFSSELVAFNNIVPANGSGASAASPQNFVFLITDGLFDSCKSNHCTSALDSSKCTALKAKATVGVIYTTYQPIMDNPNNPVNYESNYYNLVYPYQNQIASSLQACATSSDYYFPATYGNEIQTAVQALFNKTLPTSARLVQ